MHQALDALRTEARSAFEAAQSLEALGEVERRYLGKKGELTAMLRSLGKLPAEERPAFGKAVNELKIEFTTLFEGLRDQLKSAALAAELAGGCFDPTEPGLRPRLGNIHPLSHIGDELTDIFTGLGFTCLDGPEVEFEYYNFDALNIPKDHPARDSHDTFWLDDGNVLRTHTSPVQVRAMERFEPPIACIVPGRCFRNEALDASHEHSFYQMEGLLVDREISVAQLIYTMKTMLREVLKRDIEVRLRPGFFPFVEPGFELDVNCPFCSGHGCNVCKQGGWIEMCPCGMVHPEVLKAGGLDPEQYSGFAFGLGLQRLVMVRYGIGDIRDFMGGDLRFLEQFVRE
ncbi:MAG: phenylalanine--tRNA ligase subunit alpha [Planctomycetota bacterium]|nr:MAG: phenylalanine--tRNA ligase subunit alpha [Planctomycetota bacterium]